MRPAKSRYGAAMIGNRAALSRRWGAKALALIAAIILGAAGAAAAERSSMSATASGSENAYRFEFAGIDGGPLPLSAWKGHPVLVVNTASFCGYTPQYRDLEALWRQYRDKGLVVLGVPSNDFGAQEPGSAAEIKTFCETNYEIDFPLTEKVAVVGGNAHPFYRWVAASLGEGAAPKWNFHKYLIGPDGELAGAWPSSVRPGDKAITGEIDRLLTK
jgi:glutathione peroxidase